MASFVFNRQAELPPMFNGPEGRAWAAGMGAVQDAEMPRLREAALSRLPRYCSDDALDAVGAWLVLERYPGEVNGTAPEPDGTGGSGYRGRLCNAFSIWSIAASREAIVQSLRAWGVPDVSVVEDPGDESVWFGQMYTRFRVWLGPDLGTHPWTTAEPPSEAEMIQVGRQILKLKSHQSYPVDVLWLNKDGESDGFVVGPILGVSTDAYFILGLDADGDPLGGYNY